MAGAFRALAAELGDDDWDLPSKFPETAVAAEAKCAPDPRAWQQVGHRIAGAFSHAIADMDCDEDRAMPHALEARAGKSERREAEVDEHAWCAVGSRLAKVLADVSADSDCSDDWEAPCFAPRRDCAEGLVDQFAWQCVGRHAAGAFALAAQDADSDDDEDDSCSLPASAPAAREEVEPRAWGAVSLRLVAALAAAAEERGDDADVGEPSGIQEGRGRRDAAGKTEEACGAKWTPSTASSTAPPSLAASDVSPRNADSCCGDSSDDEAAAASPDSPCAFKALLSAAPEPEPEP